MMIDGYNVILVRDAFECDMTDMICYQGMPAKERTKACVSECILIVSPHLFRTKQYRYRAPARDRNAKHIKAKLLGSCVCLFAGHVALYCYGCCFFASLLL